MPSTSKPSPVAIPEASAVKEPVTQTPSIESKQETTQKSPDNSLIHGEINGALSGLGALKIELLKLHTVVRISSIVYY